MIFTISVTIWVQDFQKKTPYGYLIWTMTCDDYVNDDIKNMNEEIKGMISKIPSKKMRLMINSWRVRIQMFLRADNC